MLKSFNKKKKDNKGFTLVELVIVVAILAILVGILAPQYTKYVEKSRQSADVSNLENITKGFKVAAADTDYNVIPNGDGKSATYTILMTSDKTTIIASGAPEGTTWNNAIKEYTGYDFNVEADQKKVKLKSKKWQLDGTFDASKKGDIAIAAKVTIKSDGSVTVEYDPASVKDGTSGTAATAETP
ncbi:prepilin-type N-terminal cleavage/methylation domain-containing protein [Blautia wexlerae]|uniref:Prepilin-type N-terminal cleavage/methylation domain-containing protein n=1 Tax=Blautia wexlerae TaxID=418240 RepID=A0ABX2GNK4_9FIRM|nr:prepilin-type N-terminal cleavage/methylation domain-containing protein [Blautia wexlerae]NSF73859.1 prepilin-type N-terminal cleavage/methylation domain-containing protein [Blautia wexlerae]